MHRLPNRSRRGPATGILHPFTRTYLCWRSTAAASVRIPYFSASKYVSPGASCSSAITSSSKFERSHACSANGAEQRTEPHRCVRWPCFVSVLVRDHIALFCRPRGVLFVLTLDPLNIRFWNCRPVGKVAAAWLACELQLQVPFFCWLASLQSPYIHGNQPEAFEASATQLR